jgi:hypothetical protein
VAFHSSSMLLSMTCDTAVDTAAAKHQFLTDLRDRVLYDVEVVRLSVWGVGPFALPFCVWRCPRMPLEALRVFVPDLPLGPGMSPWLNDVSRVIGCGVATAGTPVDIDLSREVIQSGEDVACVWVHPGAGEAVFCLQVAAHLRKLSRTRPHSRKRNGV